ncbi:hypothetical protein FRB93_007559 [Tulasnella sp. JGI-2019a]|nr:hypothetical protein FRB93_007559 [Tulasnella sp. JGI-2019a]
MSQLFGILLSLIPTPNVPEFRIQKRGGKIVQHLAKCIRKEYNNPNARDYILHLNSVYEQMARGEVQNVDRPIRWCVENNEVNLGPKGRDQQPRNLSELLRALICVLEMLEDLHREPTMYHRDIQWSNIVQDLSDPSKWFVIDWDDAATPPTKAALHLREDTHSPDVRHDGHGPEVDIWGVGQFICETRVRCPLGLREYGQNMKDGSGRITAKDALESIRSYEVCE